MKRVQITILMFMLLLILPTFAQAESDVEHILQGQMKELDMSQLEEELDRIRSEYDEIMPDIDLQSVLRMLKGEDGFRLKDFISKCLLHFFGEIAVHFSLLVRIVVLSVLAVLIHKLQGAFGGDVSEVAFILAYLVLMIMAVQSFSFAINVAKDAITGMISFMIAVMPLLMTVLASLGHVISVSLFDPLLVVGSQFVGNIVSFTVLPLFYASGLLSLVDNMSDSVRVSRLASLVRSVGAVILGVVFTVFVGLTIVRGSAGAVADGVALRTGKYMAKAFVPVVGSMISDAFETVLGCSIILKNSLGVFGLILVFLLCALPALKIAAMTFMYRVAAALVQPLGNDRIPRALSAIASLLTYILASVITVGVMLLVVITVIVIAGNAGVMMR